jgi:hypothetical protein
MRKLMLNLLLVVSVAYVSVGGSILRGDVVVWGS